MVSQSELRSKSRGRTRVEQVRTKAKKEQERQISQEIKKADSQKQDLQNKISSIKKEIKRLEVQERTGIGGLANEASAQKYGKQEQLTKLKEIYSGIESGGYYKDYNKLLEQAKSVGKSIQQSYGSQFATARKISKTEGIDIPKGAKIESIKNGVVTYSMPSQTQVAITSNVKETKTTPIYGPVLPEGYVRPEDKPSKVTKIFAKKVDDKSLGQMYVTPSEVSRPDVGGRKVTVPEETVNVLTSQGTKQVGTGRVVTDYTKVSGQKLYTKKLEQNKIIDIKGVTPGKVEGEIYSSRLGGYVQPERGSKEFSQGTAVVRPETYTERINRQRVQSNLGRKVFGEDKTQNILTEDLSSIKLEQKKLKSVESSIDKLQENIKDGEWVGSEKDLNKYNRLVDKYNTLGVRKAGLFGLTRDVSLMNFDFQKKPISSSFNILSTTLSTTTGVAVERQLPRFGFDKGASELIGTGVSKVQKGALDFGKYLIPGVGGGIFAAEVGEYGVDIFKTKKSGEKLTKEQKREGIFLGSALVLGGALKGIKVSKKGIKSPRKAEVKMKQFPMKKLKFENVPKVKEVVKEVDKVDEVVSKSLVKGGTTGTLSEFNPITKTIKTGKGGRYLDIQYTDSTGQILGETTQKSLLGNLGKSKRVEYKVTPEGQLIYKTFKGNKLLSEGTKDVSKSLFGLTEREQVSKSVFSKTKKLPSKEKIRVKTKEKVFEQELVPLEDSRLLVEGQKTTKETLETATLTQPAKNILKFGKRTPKDTTIIEAEFGRKASKFSKKDVPDILKLDEKLIKGQDILTRGILYKTPRFQQSAVQTITSKGQFTIVKQDIITKLGKGRRGIFFESKKAQSLVLEPKLTTDVNVPSVKTNLPKDTTKYFISDTGVTKLEVGAFKFDIKKSGRVKGSESIVQEDIQRNVLQPKQLDGFSMESKLELNKLKLDLTPKTRTITEQRIIPKQRNIISQKPKTSQVSKLKLVVKQIQKQSKKTSQRQFNDFTKRTPERIKSKIKPRFNFDLGTPSTKTKKPITAQEQFKVFVTKFGKDVQLEDEFTTLTSAKEGLKEELKTTLRAGGFIERGGQKLKFEELGFLGSEFRPSKVNPFKVIQRKNLRLSKSPEVKEIQFFKSKGGSLL